ncbi:hypothetical protein [Mesorhizobium sp. LjNodule214]|uniref:hypothetical protein n=1 Tax=Mesorhizobium sp. LjNodule214 TaxID=3342252 RepID=UPI003ECE1113
MPTEKARYARNLAENIADLRELVPVGVSASQLKAATVWLRDIYDNFEKFWGYVGLDGKPHIEAYALEWEPLPKDVTALLFGGEELPSYGGVGVLSAIVTSENGSGQTVEHPSIGKDWFITSSTTPINFTMGGEPFVKRSCVFPEYFSSTIACHDGIKLSRFDVIEYAAYRAGYIHAQGDRYLKRSPDAARILDHLTELYPAYVRPNLDYILLSICQELLQSDAIETYRVAALK